MRILLADDHPLFLEGMCQILKQLGEATNIHCAETADAALYLLRGDIEFDLLLLDLGLPGTDGLSLLHSLHEEALLVPVIVVSASEDSRRIRAALAAGALGFIPKSHHAADMLTAIRQVLDDGEIYLPDNVRASIEHASRSEAGATGHGITPRQHQVLALLVQGRTNKQIAQQLTLTEHTVKAHVGALFQALKVTNRTECAQQAQQLGLLAAHNTSN